MDRRHFLLTTTALIALPMAAQAAEGWITMSHSVIQALLNEGKTVIVDYSVVWCSTCKVQEKAVNSLRTENPAYNEALVLYALTGTSIAAMWSPPAAKVPRDRRC